MSAAPARPPAPPPAAAPAGAVADHTPIYCRPCKRYGPLYEWGLGLTQTPHGIAKMRLQGKCGNGHKVSRFIPGGGGLSAYDLKPGPFRADEINWEAVRMTMDAATIQAATFYDYRDHCIRQMRRRKIRVDVLAEVFGLEVSAVKENVKPNKAAAPRTGAGAG